MGHHWSTAPGDPSAWFSFQFGAANTYPLFFAFFFSLLLANWTYTGYDASAHVAEETVGARVSSAWGLFLSVAVSAVVGFIFLLALTLHLPDLTPLFPATLDDLSKYSQYYFGDNAAVIYILTENLGSGLGGLFGGAIAIAMSFCGLSSVASAGRMLYAFARDDGMPGSGWLKKVNHQLPNAGQRAHRNGRRGVHPDDRRLPRRRRNGHRHRHRDQHDLPVRRVRDHDLPGPHAPRNGSATGSGASADGRDRSR